MMDAQTITKTLGGKFYNGQGNAPCPVCQPDGRPDQNALSLRNAGGKLLMNCFKSECSYYDIIAALTQQYGSDIGCLSRWSTSDIDQTIAQVKHARGSQ